MRDDRGRRWYVAWREVLLESHNKRIMVILKTIISRASQPRGDDLPAARGMAPFSQFVVELIPGLATIPARAVAALYGTNCTYFL